MGSDTHTSLYACGDRNPMALGLAPPIPDATYLYFMHRQPMGMLLQGPMLATHHHSIYNGITARFLFHAQVSSLVLRFNSTLKTPLSGVYTSSATWKHCIWRCDRLSTWRKQIHCIFAPDAFAPLWKACRPSTKVWTMCVHKNTGQHESVLSRHTMTDCYSRCNGRPLACREGWLLSPGIIKLFAPGTLVTQRQEE
jgi:hypothetical protein